MSLIIKDRVFETCVSPGSGAVTLLGAVTGYQTFNTAVGNGNTCYYAIADQTGNNWEVGVGTFTAPATLTRTTILASSNGGVIVNFSSGTQNVLLTYPASKVVTTDTLAYPPAIGSVTPNTGDFTQITASGNSSFTSNGYLQLPKGTSGQQPGSPATGMVRYNTTDNVFEGYSGSPPAWSSLGGISVVNDTTTATPIYPLLSTQSSGSITTEFTSNSKLSFIPSTGELTPEILRSDSVQIGSSGTATNNYTWYQPNSPDGTIRLGRGNAGATTTDVITVNGNSVTVNDSLTVNDTLSVTSMLDLPTWTTATRPVSPSVGTTGFNTSISSIESWNGTIWAPSGSLYQASVQTTNFTATAGYSYPVNTSLVSVTVSLPTSPTAGQQVNVFDYAGTANVHNITVYGNGNKINGTLLSILINTRRASITLTYVDSIEGWVVLSDASVSYAPQYYSISYLAVAGGGAGGYRHGGGGGAGGLIQGAITSAVTTVISVTIGAGAPTTSSDNSGANGNNTSISGTGISTLTAIGGGGGGSYLGAGNGSSGGAGGGAGSQASPGSTFYGGSGTSGQGYSGGSSVYAGSPDTRSNGGGGGAGGAGGNGAYPGTAGSGGVGAQVNIDGNNYYWAGGGGGSGWRNSGAGNGGLGGGGGGGGDNGVPAGAGGGSAKNSGANGSTGSYTGGGAGGANTGGGGGGGSQSVYGYTTTGGAGGSGIVIFSVPTVYYSGITTGSPTITTYGPNTILTFTSSGTYTV